MGDGGGAGSAAIAATAAAVVRAVATAGGVADPAASDDNNDGEGGAWPQVHLPGPQLQLKNPSPGGSGGRKDTAAAAVAVVLVGGNAAGAGSPPLSMAAAAAAASTVGKEPRSPGVPPLPSAGFTPPHPRMRRKPKPTATAEGPPPPSDRPSDGGGSCGRRRWWSTRTPRRAAGTHKASRRGEKADAGASPVAHGQAASAPAVANAISPGRGMRTGGGSNSGDQGPRTFQGGKRGTAAVRGPLGRGEGGAGGR